jgi:hypothetical protein
VARRPCIWLDPAGPDPATGREWRVCDLVRAGEGILGGRHNPERAARWREWWSELTEEQRALYRRARRNGFRKGW